MSPALTTTPEERRAKRQLRRDRQRASNIGRAAKMHAARLEWERQAESTRPVVLSNPSTPQFHVGCSGWFYWHWRGVVYPADLPTRDWFQHSSERSMLWA